MKAKTLVIKLISVASVACLVVSSLSLYLPAKASASSPIAISTCTQLQNMDQDLTADYVLTKDISCYGSGSWNSGAGFSPIGLAESGTTFTGTFNGQGHTISGLTINRSTTSAAGLFYIIQGTTVQSVNFVGSSISGHDNSGTLAAGIVDSQINNIHIEQASVSTAASSNTGGLAGYDYANGGNVSISGSWFSGTVDGFFDTGGLVGYMSFVNIINSYSTGAVSGTANVGGLVGEFQDFWGINNTFSQADVTASGNNAGGLLGQIGDGMHGAPFVYNSYATGSVTSSADNAGGLVGVAIAPIINSFAAGAVSASSATRVGGFVGDHVDGDSNNNVYDRLRTGQTSCAGGGSCPAAMSGVTAVNTNASPNSTYFFNNFSSAPLSSWDTSVWVKKASGFPVFARTAHNVSTISTQPTSTSIQVNWSPPNSSDTPDITGYTLKYRLGDLSNGWSAVSVPATAHPSYTITGLTASTSYSIAIFTNDSAGSSSGVGVIAKTTAAPTATASQAHVTSSSSGFGPGGSTTDSSAPANVTIDYFGDYLTAGYTVNDLHVGDVVHFQVIHDGALAEHTATVKTIGDSYIVLTIASSPFDVHLDDGQTKDISVYQNGHNDLKLTLNGAGNGTASVTFKALSTSPLAVTTGRHQVQPTKSVWSRLGIATIVILVIGMFIYAKRYSRRRG